MHNKLKLNQKSYEYYKSNIYYNERNLKNLPSCRDNFGDNLDEKDGDGGVGGILTPHTISSPSNIR